MLYRQLVVPSQTEHPFRAADGLLYCTDWWVGAARSTVSHASPKATKNRPPHLSAVRKRHSVASGGAAAVVGTY